MSVSYNSDLLSDIKKAYVEKLVCPDVYNKIQVFSVFRNKNFNVDFHELNLRSVSFKIERVFRKMEHSEKNFIDLLESEIEDKDHVLSILNTCKCCSRHQHNRPSKVDDFCEKKNVKNHIDSFHPLEIYNCDCNCRHISRFICRVHMLQSQDSSF